MIKAPAHSSADAAEPLNFPRPSEWRGDGGAVFPAVCLLLGAAPRLVAALGG